MTTDVEPLFMCLPFVSFLELCLFKSLAYLFYFLTEFSLYSLEISPSLMGDLQIFSPILSLVFKSKSLDFAELKLIILKKKKKTPQKPPKINNSFLV
jgi:hypothetical protein